MRTLGSRARRTALLVGATLLGAVLVAPTASACDICAIYTATELRESRTGLRLGVAQQISEFTELRIDGRRVSNPAGERLSSAITQFVVGYQPMPELALQVAVPWIRRDFRRLRDRGIDAGNETGFGDLSLLASYTVFSRMNERSVFRLSALGGLKLPTGDADRLREGIPRPLDPNEVRDRLNEHMRPRPGPNGAPTSVGSAHVGPAGSSLSGIHGHDLSLGTGSTDPVVGGQMLWTWRRAIMTGQVQYVLRTRGRHGYEYADELTAAFAPGAFVRLNHRHSLVLQTVMSVEAKGRDEQFGKRVGDTGFTALYVGPGVNFTWGSSLSFEFAADIPAYLDNTALQIVPDFRLRAGLMWRL